MAISRSQDTEERRYFRLRYDAVKRAGPTLWFSHCAQWATRHELVLQNGTHPVALNLWIWSSRLHVDLGYDSPVKRAAPASYYNKWPCIFSWQVVFPIRGKILESRFRVVGKKREKLGFFRVLIKVQFCHVWNVLFRWYHTASWLHESVGSTPANKRHDKRGV